MEQQRTDEVTGETRTIEAVAARQSCLVAGDLAIGFTSSGPGAGQMAGTLSASAAEAAGREVEIVGATEPDRWIVTIDGEEQSAANVAVHAGDTVTWRSGEGLHGVTFQNWKETQQLLEIDEAQSEGLSAKDPDVFGPDPVGTEAFADDRVLVVATVQEVAGLVEIVNPLACELMTLEFVEAEFVANPAAINQTRLFRPDELRGGDERFSEAQQLFFSQSTRFEGQQTEVMSPSRTSE